MYLYQAAMLPVIGALIGWITNLLAVRSLFHPYTPIRIPLLGYQLQGMLPKYRFELAKNIGSLIQKELMPMDKLLNFLRSEELAKEVIHSAEEVVRVKVMDKLPGFLPLSIKRLIAEALVDQVHKQLPLLINELVDRFEYRIKDKFELAEFVESRVNQFPLEQLETLIFQVAGRELKHVEVLGGVLGFLIGLVQAGLLFLFD